MAVWYCGSTKWTAVTAWAAVTSYSIGDLRRQLATPTVGNERVFRCTTAGVSGASEPTWTLTAGSTTNDGTAVWTEVTGQSTYGWNAPHARMANAAAWMAAGEDCYVSQAHAATQTTAITITSPGTAGAVCRFLCVNDGAAPPTAIATGASETTTGTSAFTILGFAYFYGVTFNVGTGAGQASFTLGSNTTSFGFKFEASAVKILATSTLCKIAIGAVGSSMKDGYCEFVNTTVQFSNASQSINPISGRFFWRDTVSAVLSGTLPTTLIIPAAASSCQVEVSGVDYSALGSGKNLVSLANTNFAVHRFRNCKTGASVAFGTGTISGQGGTEAYFDNCNDTSGNNRFTHYVYEGTISQETTKVRTNGATDGTTPISWAMASNATGPTFNLPLRSTPISIWNDTTGSPKTVTIEILHDSVTNLKDSEVWVQVEYLADSGDPAGVLVTDRTADFLATAADQDTSTAAWTTTGLTNPNKQKLVVSFTPQLKGIIRARVMLAKANYTIYIDPLVTVSGGPSTVRQFNLPAGGFTNETQAPGGASGGLLLNPGMTGGMRS